MGYQGQWKKEENNVCVDKAVMHVVRLDARIGCIVPTINT